MAIVGTNGKSARHWRLIHQVVVPVAIVSLLLLMGVRRISLPRHSNASTFRTVSVPLKQRSIEKSGFQIALPEAPISLVAPRQDVPERAASAPAFVSDISDSAQFIRPPPVLT